MNPASTPIQLSTRSSLSALEAALDLFRELRPEMAIQLPLVFLLIAQHKGIGAARLCQLTGLSQSAMSRNITALTKDGTRDEPGLGLVVKTIDPANPRAHAIYLTGEGRAFAARLADVLAKAVEVRRGGEAGSEDCRPDIVLPTAGAMPEAFTGAHWEVWGD